MCSLPQHCNDFRTHLSSPTSMSPARAGTIFCYLLDFSVSQCLILRRHSVSLRDHVNETHMNYMKLFVVSLPKNTQIDFIDMESMFRTFWSYIGHVLGVEFTWCRRRSLRHTSKHMGSHLPGLLKLRMGWIFSKLGRTDLNYRWYGTH